MAKLTAFVFLLVSIGLLFTAFQEDEFTLNDIALSATGYTLGFFGLLEIFRKEFNKQFSMTLPNKLSKSFINTFSFVAGYLTFGLFITFYFKALLGSSIPIFAFVLLFPIILIREDFTPIILGNTQNILIIVLSFFLAFGASFLVRRSLEKEGVS